MAVTLLGHKTFEHTTARTAGVRQMYQYYKRTTVVAVVISTLITLINSMNRCCNS
jgi:hypothetical protein